jgi:hypothetical protein
MVILRFFVKIAHESLLHQAWIQQFWKRGARLLFANFYPIYTRILLNCRTPPWSDSVHWYAPIPNVYINLIRVVYFDHLLAQVHSAGYLILRNEFRFTQEIARQNIQVSIYIRSTGLWPNAWIHVSQSLAIIRNAEYTNLTYT